MSEAFILTFENVWYTDVHIYFNIVSHYIYTLFSMFKRICSNYIFNNIIIKKRMAKIFFTNMFVWCLLLPRKVKARLNFQRYLVSYGWIWLSNTVFV